MTGHGSADPLTDTVYKRGELLCAIDDHPRGKPALTEAVDTSRSTVDRGVDELEDAGCVERRNGLYHTTLLGELSCARYRKYRSNVGALGRARKLVARLPESARVSATFLRGADVRSARSAAPEASLQPTIERLASADRLRGLAPVGLSLYVDLIYEHANMNDLSVEIIVQKDALEPIIDLDRNRLNELVAEGHLEILATEKTLHYALWIMDSPEGVDVGATVYENGGIEGHLMNSSPKAVKWAHSEYDRHRQQAEQIPVDDLFDG